MTESNNPLHDARILIVEDEALIAEELRDRLQHLGLRVVGVADTAAGAFELAGRERPHLALMDIRLKGPVDGVEAAAQINRAFGVPVVFMTAHSDQATVERALAFGPHGYVLKPFHEQELALAIGVAIRRGAIERDLWQSVLAHETILAGIGEGVIATDTLLRIRYMNAAAEALTGWAAADAQGRSVGDVLCLTDDVGRLLSEQQLVGGLALAPPSAMNCRAANGIGRTTPVALNVAGIASKGVDIGLTFTLHDLSQRRRAEREINELNAQLERRVAERTAELAALRDQAERLARVKSDFLANMSHEIRTPLHAVLGLAGIGARESQGRASHATFRKIVDAGEHLLDIVDSILDLSKLEAGKLRADSQPLRIADVVAQAQEVVCIAAARKGLRFSVQVASDMPTWVQGDALRVRQILVNLLSNAVKFTEAGEVRLDVCYEGDRMRFRVSDTGIGIAPAQLSLLFSPFEQLDSSSTRKFGGTGLGLTLSQSMARLMGGLIVVESAERGGSVFTLRLPLVVADGLPAQAGELSQAAPRRLAGLRVLAVDDVEVNQMILADLLQHEGADATIVASGMLALAAQAAPVGRAFDVVLTDIQMPGMDGYEATQRLLAIDPELPVIALTAHAMDEERERCLAAGMVDRVTKPFDTETLVQVILKHVRRRTPCEPAATGGGTRGPASDARTQAHGAGQVVDWDALRRRYSAMPQLVARLIDAAVATQGSMPRRLRQAAVAGDVATIRAIAHDVVSVAGNMEAHALSHFARMALQTLHDSPELACEIGETLASGIANLLSVLQAYRNAGPAATAA